jgi:hypothetical protein
LAYFNIYGGKKQSHGKLTQDKQSKPGKKAKMLQFCATVDFSFLAKSYLLG